MIHLKRKVAGVKKEYILCSILVLVLQLSASGFTAKAQVPTGTTSSGMFFQVDTMELDGKKIDQVIINGPPEPLPGIERQTVSLPESNIMSGVATLTVPAYNWSFGCSATSASMIAAYYDRNSFPNMYTGPTNGGVMPMDNSSWPDVTINSETRHQCPLSATRNGLDGRTTRGHVDDYWISYDSAGPDPYVTNLWTEHTLGSCTGDFMKTNRWADYSNRDGATTLIYFTDGSPTTASDLESYNMHNGDGGYGLKLFYESRGYSVTTMYNQYIAGYPGTTPGNGYTFSQYKAEIDAGRPVMIHVEGHTMVGIGYDASSNLVYLNDTWDYSTHTMTWGGNYMGMAHLGVTIVHLAGGSLPPPPVTSSFPWAMYLPAISGKEKTPPQWGAGSEVCCSTSSATFSLTSSSVTKNSTVANCSTPGTWEGWQETTAGNKSFTWRLSSANCGSYTSSFDHSLFEGKSYLFQIELVGSDLVVYVYLATRNAGSAAKETAPATAKTVDEIKASMKLVDTIPLNIPKGAFSEISCKTVN